MNSKFLAIIAALFFLIISFAKQSYALEENTGMWLDSSLNKDIPGFKNLSVLLDTQLRLLDEANYYQASNVQTGLGYHISPTASLWLGYEWFSKDPIRNTQGDNRGWQQMVWQIFETKSFAIRTRTRFEQIDSRHQPEWENRFREKVSLYFMNAYLGKYTPLIYDEIFIKLNSPGWSDSKTFEQNRLFIGMDIPTTKTTFLEVGYLQQTLFDNTETTMDHILYLGINFNINGRPLPQYVR